MIREYAPSLSNRGHFLNEVEVSKMRGGKGDSRFKPGAASTSGEGGG